LAREQLSTDSSAKIQAATAYDRQKKSLRRRRDQWRFNPGNQLHGGGEGTATAATGLTLASLFWPGVQWTRPRRARTTAVESRQGLPDQYTPAAPSQKGPRGNNWITAPKDGGDRTGWPSTVFYFYKNIRWKAATVLNDGRWEMVEDEDEGNRRAACDSHGHSL